MKKQLSITWLILPLTVLAGFTIDFYAPSLPAIANYFQIPDFYVKLLIPSYLLSYMIGYLILGIFSDRFGRKKLLLLSIILFILTSLAQAAATNVFVLLFFHFFQGLAVSGPDVLGRTILADRHEKHGLAKQYALISLTWSLCPMVAPIAGAYIQAHFNWQMLFIAQSIYAIILLILLIILLPETATGERTQLTHLHHHFKQIVFSKVFIGSAICRGGSFGFVLLFSLTAPFLVQEVLKMSVIDYGYIVFLLALSSFFGVAINRILLSFWTLNRVLMTGVTIMNTVVWGSFIIIISRDITRLQALIMMLGFFCGRGIMLSNLAVVVIDKFKHMAGSVNAYSGTALIFIALGVSCFATFLKAENLIPMALAYVILTTIITISYILFVRPEIKAWSKDSVTNSVHPSSDD